MKGYRSFQRGFTLVELLVILAILGVLSIVTISVLNPVGQLAKGRDGRRKADLVKIQSAMEQYRADAGYYPSTDTYPRTCGDPLQNSDASVTYIKILCDPLFTSGTTYRYAYVASPSGCDNTTGNLCTSYTLTACAENTSDSAATQPTDFTAATFPPNGLTCPTGYVFQVTSP